MGTQKNANYIETLDSLLATAVENDWEVWQLRVNQAFIQDDVEFNVFRETS